MLNESIISHMLTKQQFYKDLTPGLSWYAIGARPRPTIGIHPEPGLFAGSPNPYHSIPWHSGQHITYTQRPHTRSFMVRDRCPASPNHRNHPEPGLFAGSPSPYHSVPWHSGQHITYRCHHDFNKYHVFQQISRISTESAPAQAEYKIRHFKK